MARHEMSEPFITINGDDMFEPSVIRNLLASTADITMVTDVKAQYDEDDMKIITEGEQVLRVGKQIPLSKTNGESVGIIQFKGAGCRTYVEKLDAMVRHPENLNLFYLRAIQELIDDGIPVHFSRCEESAWGEIDFHPDLELIRNHVVQNKLIERIWKKR